MYERLDKLRNEVTRIKQKIEDDKVKLRLAEDKLKEAENQQILADIGALNLKPEQVAELLKTLTGGKIPSIGHERPEAPTLTHTVKTGPESKDDDEEEESNE